MLLPLQARRQCRPRSSLRAERAAISAEGWNHTHTHSAHESLFQHVSTFFHLLYGLKWVSMVSATNDSGTPVSSCLFKASQLWFEHSWDIFATTAASEMDFSPKVTQSGKMQKSLADQKSWQELGKAIIPETAQILLHLEGAGIYNIYTVYCIYIYMGVCGCVCVYRYVIYKLRNIHCPCRGSNAVMEEAGTQTHGTWGMERPGVKRGWKIPYKWRLLVWKYQKIWDMTET